MNVLFEPAVMLSVLCDGCAGTVSVLYLLLGIYIIVITIVITHGVIVVDIEKSF